MKFCKSTKYFWDFTAKQISKADVDGDLLWILIKQPKEKHERAPYGSSGLITSLWKTQDWFENVLFTTLMCDMSFQVSLGLFSFWRLACMKPFYVLLGDFYILKQVPVYFCCLGECCNGGLLWSSRYGLLKLHRDFHPHEGEESPITANYLQCCPNKTLYQSVCKKSKMMSFMEQKKTKTKQDRSWETFKIN